MTFLAELAPSGFPVLGPVIDLVARFMLFIFENTGHSLPFTIVLFTVALKTLLLPLTLKSIRSSKMMQDIAPEVKKLQKQHKDDRAAFSQAQMELYQKYGVNPLAGCLPVLIQLPVFIIVYNAMTELVKASELGVQPFLWVADLTKNIGADIPGMAPFQFLIFTGNNDTFRTLAFLAFFFQVIQTRMSLPNAAKAAQQDQQTRSQRLLLTASTCLVLFFGWSFIAAMVLYWVVQAMYSVVQQYFITGWGSLTDIFPFLPTKQEKVRELKEVDPSKQKPGMVQQWMAKAQMQDASRRAPAEDAGPAETPREATKQQQLRPDGRPKAGSTLSISGGGNTPAQRPAKATNGAGSDDAPEPNRSRAKGSGGQKTSAKAIGTTETTRTNRAAGKGEPIIADPRPTPAAPVPRKSSNANATQMNGTQANRATGNESAGGGGE